MKIPKTFRTEVWSSSDYNIGIPSIVEFEIDDATAREIIRLAEFVINESLYKVEKFDWRPKYLKHYSAEHQDPNHRVSVEASRINVSRDKFWLSALIWDTNIEIRSEELSITEIAEYFEVKLRAGV